MPKIRALKKPANAKLPFEFLNMDNASEPARINIYDIIGETWWDEGITGKSFTNELSAAGKDRELNVHINSVGGNVMDGTVIYNALLNHQGAVNIIIDGYAISMASVIAMAGDTVKINSTGMLMIHKPLNGCYGNATDMRKNADTLDKVEAALSSAYLNQTDLSAETIAEMLEAETWLTATEAKEHGFVDEIIEDSSTQIENCFNQDVFSNFSNVPETLLATVASDEDGNEPEEETDIVDDVDEINDPVVEEEPDATETENHRVLDIMNQCKALGLDHMAMDLIKNKTTIADAGTILSNVKAGIDSSNQTHGHHKQNLDTTMSNDDVWTAAKQINKR